jgi:glycosyltransferase involved in cell wall biosynthesis
MNKIVIHYPFIAVYRIPIFTLLDNSNNYNYEFWAAEKSKNKFLLTNNKTLKIVDTPFKLINIPIINKKLEWQPKAIQLVQSEKIAIYIALGNPNSLSTWLCFIIAKLRKIPIFIWSHGYLKEENSLKGFIRKYFYKFGNKHLLYGNTAKKIMLSKGFKESELHVIYNSLDYEKQKFYRNQLTYKDRLKIRDMYNIKENSITIVTIGRLAKKFKLEQVVESIKMLKDKNIDSNLIIIGDGEEKENLITLVKEFKIIDKVFFYGACHEEEEISKLYNASDYSVVMGSIGLAAIHSLAYGIPVITNNNMAKHHPEIEAIINNKTGFLFEEDNLEDFISKLQPIKYRGKISENSIEIIERYYTPQRQKKLIEYAIDEYFKEKNEK